MCIVFYFRNAHGAIHTSDVYGDSVLAARERMRQRCNDRGLTLLCAKLHNGQRFERGGRFV